TIKILNIPENQVNYTSFRALLILIMRYYILNKNKDKLDIISYYMGYSIYWSVWSRQFVKFKPDKNIMRYTINNLSNRFVIKQTGSIENMLKTGVDTSINTYYGRFIRGSDYDIWSVIGQIKTRIHGYLKSISEEYY